jgi:hypothetical protein
MAFTTPDGYLIEQVFVWPTNSKGPRLDFSSVNLRYFLKRTLKWDWINDARITPRFNDNVVDITCPPNPQKTSTISIRRDTNKAVLRQQGQKMYEFSINPNDLFLSIEAKTDRTGIDFMETPFVNRCKELLIAFLTRLRTQITRHNPSFDILDKDEVFKKALNFVDRETKLK